jgi:hypothetical protein
LNHDADDLTRVAGVDAELRLVFVEWHKIDQRPPAASVPRSRNFLKVTSSSASRFANT